jgi:hypothetical protein
MAAFAAVHDPPGRSSSVSPDGVAVNKGAVAKMIFPQLQSAFLGRVRSTDVDLTQGSIVARTRLTQIKWYRAASPRVCVGRRRE